MICVLLKTSGCCRSLAEIKVEAWRGSDRRRFHTRKRTLFCWTSVYQSLLGLRIFIEIDLKALSTLGFVAFDSVASVSTTGRTAIVEVGGSCKHKSAFPFSWIWPPDWMYINWYIYLRTYMITQLAWHFQFVFSLMHHFNYFFRI